MRRPALALLVAISGCNWAFGIDATVLGNGDGGDDSPDAPAPARDRLVWGIATTNTTGAPVDPVLKSIGSESMRDVVPTIMIGEPLGGMPLATASYDITDGSFEIPFHLRDVPHRIVYTLPNETVPHEVQWSISGAVLVVPRATRFDAPAIPPGSGYAITPTGLGGSLAAPSIATTGVFSFDRTGPFGTPSATTTYDFDTNADMLTTPRAAPQGSLGDYVILGDWTPRTGNQDSFAGFAITHIDLTGAQSTPSTEPAWMSGSTVNRTLTTNAGCGADCLPTIDSGTAASRFDLNLPALSTTTKPQYFAYGISPTTKLPGFVPGRSPEFVDQPMILSFAESKSIDSSITLADPTKPDLLPSFTRVLAARVMVKRIVNGATLTSSIQAITNSFAGQLEFKAPLATLVKLGANSLIVADTLQIDASSQPTVLSWTDEVGYAADDYIVTLYEITNNRLAPIRIYHVLTSAVTVDGSQLMPGHTYVFAITSRTGLSKAKQGNYLPENVTYPFYETTTFATAFSVKP